MGWSSPRTYTVGEIITKSILDAHVKDNLRYLKGLDGAVTLSDALILPDGAGYYLHIPILTTTQRDALTPTAGMLIYNSTLTAFNKYENGAWRADLGFNSHHGDLSGLTDDDHTQYQKESLLTTAGDVPYATGASTWVRLPIGTAGQILRVNAGATAPEWLTGESTKQFFVSSFYGDDTTGLIYSGDYVTYHLAAGKYTSMSFRVPNDFASLTSVKIIAIPEGTGSFDWTVTTDFAAAGEASAANSDSATADTQAVTNNIILELDISAAFTGLGANDNVGVKFLVDALTTTTALYIVGLDVKYA